MASERADFSGQRLDQANFAQAQIHNSNFAGARITGGWLKDADIDGYIGGLKVNGVEVAPLISAELDRLYPERTKLRADDPQVLATAWETIEALWKATNARAQKLPEPLLHERVNHQWSYLETLRHLVFATDAWIFYMVDRETRPYHPWGVTHDEFSGGPGLGVDPEADPSSDDVLSVRKGRMERVRRIIDGLTPDELERRCAPPDSTGYPQETETVRDCFRIILNEEWEHNRYANRDLAILEARQA